MDPSSSWQKPEEASMAEPEEDAEFWPLSGKPYFFVVLTKSHLATRFQMGLRLPVKLKLCKDLPAATVPAKFIYRGKTWDLVYIGDRALKRFENQGWEKFAIDNNLAVGDACVFELMDSTSRSSSSSIKFKVQFLKGDFPNELLEKAEGSSMNNPMILD